MLRDYFKFTVSILIGIASIAALFFFITAIFFPQDASAGFCVFRTEESIENVEEKFLCPCGSPRVVNGVDYGSAPGCPKR